jgi:hypothetical protein
MPTEQLMKIWGDGIGGINLSHTVGGGRHNTVGDVMLIQALLNFIAEAEGSVEKIGVRSTDELPNVDGNWDSFFYNSVTAFKRKNAHILLSSGGEPFDHVYPVSRDYEIVDDDKWPAIMLLNQYATDATGIMRNREIENSSKDPGFPYPTSMLIMFPELRQHLI